MDEARQNELNHFLPRMREAVDLLFDRMKQASDDDLPELVKTATELVAVILKYEH